jgi:Primase C terminal 2 (PriCT-2)
MTDAIVYDYYDAAGTLVHQTVRCVPKRFFQRQPDPERPGAYIKSLQGIEPVLYHLPQVLAAIQRGDSVYLVEGEKDADTLAALGLTATTCAMGAKAWRPSYTDTLRGASVILLGDNDPDGAAHVQLVVTKLVGHVARLKVVPGLHTEAPKSDVSDWVAAGGTHAALAEAVAAVAWGTHPVPTPPPRPKPTPTPRWVDRTPDYERVAEALSYVTNNDVPYETWREIGMALHSTGEGWAEDLWDGWSQHSSKYNARKQARTWGSFHVDGKITIGTLFHHAKDGGWSPRPREETHHGRATPAMTQPWQATAQMYSAPLSAINATEVTLWHSNR